jgi:hypothetical protein
LKRLCFSLICIFVILLAGALLFIAKSWSRSEFADARFDSGGEPNPTGKAIVGNGVDDGSVPGSLTGGYGSASGSVPQGSGFEDQDGIFVNGDRGSLSDDLPTTGFGPAGWGGGGASLFADNSTGHSSANSDSGPGAGSVSNPGGGFGSGPSGGQNFPPVPSNSNSPIFAPYHTGSATHPLAVPDQSSTFAMLAVSLMALTAIYRLKPRAVEPF